MALKGQLDHIQSSNGNSNDRIAEVSQSLDGFDHDLQNATVRIEERSLETSANMERTNEHCMSFHMHAHIHVYMPSENSHTCTYVHNLYLLYS